MYTTGATVASDHTTDWLGTNLPRHITVTQSYDIKIWRGQTSKLSLYTVEEHSTMNSIYVYIRLNILTIATAKSPSSYQMLKSLVRGPRYRHRRRMYEHAWSRAPNEPLQPLLREYSPGGLPYTGISRCRYRRRHHLREGV